MEFFGRGPANWGMFFRTLFLDRNEDGQPFSWFLPASLWVLEANLLWTPARQGHLNLGSQAVGESTLRKAVFMHRWAVDRRQAEAEAIQKAHEEAARRSRG